MMNNQKEDTMSYGITGLLVMFWPIFFILYSCNIITTHSGWCKRVIRKEIGKKSKITVTLSILFLLVLVTGIILLGANGANSDMGLWYYKNKNFHTLSVSLFT